MQNNDTQQCGPVEHAIGFIEGFADDPSQEGVGQLLEGLAAVNDTSLSAAELATVRAALQAYADWGMGDPMARLSYLEDMASNQNTLPPLGAAGVAALLEKLERMAELQTSA